MAKQQKKSSLTSLDWRVQPFSGKTDFLSENVTVRSISTGEANTGTNYDGFFLNGVLFGWCTRGRMKIHLSDGNPIDVKKGQFLIVYGQRIIRNETLEDKTIGTNIILTGIGAMNFADEIGLYDGFVTKDEMPSSSVRMLEEMVARHKKDNSVSNAVIMNLVSNMLTGVVDRARLRGKAQFLDAIKCFDDLFLLNDFSAKHAAAELGISPNTLYLIFRDHGLTSPGAFATSRQLRRARGLLAHSRFKISEISKFCGFATPAHFSVFIKKHTGHTPRELRNGDCDDALALRQLGGGGGTEK